MHVCSLKYIPPDMAGQQSYESLVLRSLFHSQSSQYLYWLVKHTESMAYASLTVTPLQGLERAIPTLALSRIPRVQYLPQADTLDLDIVYWVTGAFYAVDFQEVLLFKSKSI